MVQEALRLRQSVFAGGKRCNCLFLSWLISYLSTAKNLRIWAFSTFFKVGVGGFLFGVYLLSSEPCGLETILHLTKSRDSSVLSRPESLGVNFHVSCPCLFSKRA